MNARPKKYTGDADERSFNACFVFRAKESSSPKHKTVALELSLANSSFVKLNVTKPYKLNDEIYVVAGFRPAGPAEIVLQVGATSWRAILKKNF